MKDNLYRTKGAFGEKLASIVLCSFGRYGFVYIRRKARVINWL